MGRQLIFVSGRVVVVVRAAATACLPPAFRPAPGFCAGYVWLIQLLRLVLYAMFLLPGFIQVRTTPVAFCSTLKCPAPEPS
jgi:hypothetical protein